MLVAEIHDMKVIEDAAHAIPSWLLSKESGVRGQELRVSSQRKKIGTIGDITCFSFYATKTLSTGEGGMITTENDDWADRMRILRIHGISNDAWKRYTKEVSWYYEVVEAGYKYNMTDIQAALGLAQLKKVEWMREQRKEIANRYTESFQSLKEILVPSVKSDRESAWHLYVIKQNLEALRINRNQFILELKNRGVSALVHFIPLYRHPYYRNTFGYNPKDFPNSEWLYERIISLAIYPGMTEVEVDYVIEAVVDVVKRNRR